MGLPRMQRAAPPARVPTDAIAAVYAAGYPTEAS